MATLQKWITRAMRWQVDTIQYPLATAEEDANVVYHQIEDYITSAIGEWFFWDILTASATVANCSEYTIPTLSTGNFNGAPKVESVSIKYTTGGEYIPARLVDRQTLLQTHDIAWYEVNQPDGDPIYFIADSSIFIYPYPKESVTDGIKYYGIKSLVDITATTTEADMFGGKIPVKYYYMISEGMKQFIFTAKGLPNESEWAKNIFEREILPSLVEKLGNRKVGISIRGQADLSKYK